MSAGDGSFEVGSEIEGYYAFRKDWLVTKGTINNMVVMGTEKGRSVKKDLKIGICGEHGGEPSSIDFCYRTGLNYVSCSPYRVPIARLAAAQAVLNNK